MKRTLFLLALSALASSTACAAVGDTVNTSKYVTDGVNCYTINNSVSVFLDSTRFYDSAKQSYYSTAPDSLMCWAHSAANSIQYWQTYYGVFTKDSIPYGSREGTTAWADKVTDLQVADTMRVYFKNVGEDFATATEWYMRGEITNANAMKIIGGGGYYDEYYDSTQPYTKYDVKNAELSILTNAVFNAFGLEKNGNSYVQAEAGLIPLVGIAYQDAQGNEYGHSISCYAFTTDSNGNIDTLYLTDPDKVDGKMDLAYVGKDSEGRLVLYSDASKTTPLAYDTKGNTWYIRNVWHLNTPEVLQDMLAEYSDVENEAQVWNGGSSVWSIQEASTEELPTAATGWDVHVNGESIAAQGHDGYYHTYDIDGRAVEFGNHASDDKRNVSIVGKVSASSITVSASGYSFTAGSADAGIADGANMTIRSGASLESKLAIKLNNLTLEAGSTLKILDSIVVTGDFVASAAETSVYTTRATITPEVNLLSALDLREADSITLQATVNMNGNYLYLSEGAKFYISQQNEGDEIAAFTNIGKLYLGDSMTESYIINAEIYYAGSETPLEYLLVYNQQLGSLSFVNSIPEPTSATLSLLALTALVGRRRRK